MMQWMRKLINPKKRASAEGREKEVKEKEEKKSKVEEVDAQAPAPDNNKPAPVTVPVPMAVPAPTFKQTVFKFAARTLTRGCKALREDFLANPRIQLDPEKTRAFHANKVKNRYNDIGCLDAHRVKLRDYGDNDYIHANYVKTPLSEKRFICTQAPLEATIPDFWHMVLQEGCQNIMMMVSMAEKEYKVCVDGKEYNKYTGYYPTEKDAQIMYGDYAVSCVERKAVKFNCNTKVEVFETTLRVEHAGKSLTLKHYWVCDWNMLCVPPADWPVIELLQKTCNTEAPIVAHSSAGVGRTGIIVMIQNVLEMVQLGQPFESLAPLLNEIRSQRCNSIQTLDQYYFIHLVLIQHFFNIELLDAKSGASHLKTFREDYNKNILGNLVMK